MGCGLLQLATMEEEQIKIKVWRISAVAPAIPTVKHRIFLSNLDLFMLPINNVPRLLFYKSDPQKEFSAIVELLKSSLSLVLVDFYPLAGRLIHMEGGEEPGRPEVDFDDWGVEFVEASIGIALQDLENDGFQHRNFFKKLVRTRPDGHENNDGRLLSIQVTAFQGGGICIGLNLHHVIGDGSSLWHFMKSWGERSRGLPISANPEHMRTIFKRHMNDHPIPNISLKFEEVVTDLIKEAQVLKYMNVAKDDLPFPVISEPQMAHKDDTENGIDQQSVRECVETKLKISTFHFSEEIIGNLKERAGASTSFVAVAAQFWRCVMKALEVPENEPVYFVVHADCRGRVTPPLPRTYFGNCICKAIARTTAKQLLGQDICFAAGLIHHLIGSCTTDVQINNTIDWLESQHGCGRGVRDLIGRYCVDVESSPRFPVYEIDYGWGKPSNVQAAWMDEVGTMMLLPGVDGGRSIDVSTCLPRHQMETLKRILMIIPD